MKFLMAENKNRKFNAILLMAVSVFILASCTKAEEPIATSKPSEPITGAALGAMATPAPGNVNVNCPAKFLCETLVSETSSCEADLKSKACDSLIQTTKKLNGKYDCQRASDTSPVPAILLCDEKSTGLQERVTKLLAKLHAAP